VPSGGWVILSSRGAAIPRARGWWEGTVHPRLSNWCVVRMSSQPLERIVQTGAAKVRSWVCGLLADQAEEACAAPRGFQAESEWRPMPTSLSPIRLYLPFIDDLGANPLWTWILRPIRKAYDVGPVSMISAINPSHATAPPYLDEHARSRLVCRMTIGFISLSSLLSRSIIFSTCSSSSRALVNFLKMHGTKCKWRICQNMMIHLAPCCA
jgi:hypothetical protein